MRNLGPFEEFVFAFKRLQEERPCVCVAFLVDFIIVFHRLGNRASAILTFLKSRQIILSDIENWPKFRR